MSKNKSFIVRFIEHRNLTEKRPVYWGVNIAKFIKDSIRTIASLVVGLILVAFTLFMIMLKGGDAIIPLLDSIIPFSKYGYIAVLVWIFIGLILLIIVGYITSSVNNRKQAKKISSWKTLAESKHLTFVSGKFPRYKSYIIGHYRHHHLQLETFEKNQGKQSYICTRLFVSVGKLINESPQKDQHPPDEQVSSEEAMSLLTPTDPSYILKGATLKGSITAQTFNQNVYVCHVQDSIENDSEYLGYLFDLLSDLADAYSSVVAPGGEAVPFLKDLIASTHHESIATELLKAIARKTTEHWGERVSQFVCPSCLTRYKAHKVLLESLDYLTYYGCRICGQSREGLEGRLVAVLDSRMDSERVQQNGTWRVNWLVRRTLFDFDQVEIVQATDEDVERFVVQVGNDTDEFRRSRYREMACTIVPDCRLSENTLRILKSTFG